MKIIVRTIFEDYHRWPSAPEEVSFLRNLHRHLFYVEIGCQVTKDDRELEFFMVKKDLDHVIEGVKAMPSDKSCEQMAKAIKSGLEGLYPRKFLVRVFEDNENGCEVGEDDLLPTP